LPFLGEGFSIFFSVFEVTRRVALRAKITSQTLLDKSGTGNTDEESAGAFKRNLPRIVHCGALITGGVGNVHAI
jgi:hypothetical protein